MIKRVINKNKVKNILTNETSLLPKDEIRKLLFDLIKLVPDFKKNDKNWVEIVERIKLL